jgi:hypothetical protein
VTESGFSICNRQQLRKQDTMTRITTIVQNGRIEVKAPDELPDGSQVVVEVSPLRASTMGITEAEWRDDPEALADWDAWIKSLTQIDARDAASPEGAGFEEEFRRFNIEAVRKQMLEGPSE